MIEKQVTFLPKSNIPLRESNYETVSWTSGKSASMWKLNGRDFIPVGVAIVSTKSCFPSKGAVTMAEVSAFA